ncbi:hypothetical protein MKX08_008038 [Trichoderma sp. CBMAI-0020]|nr:hypothetical protein MKX08_008038 [Trichoderma sp. CBMAI-0020]WOD45578.1 hypothetical protein [Trichoderma atroviride]
MLDEFNTSTSDLPTNLHLATKTAEDVTGGRVSTSELRDWFPPIASNSKKVKFPAKLFDKTPKVFIGISELDMDSSSYLRAKVGQDGPVRVCLACRFVG